MKPSSCAYRSPGVIRVKVQAASLLKCHVLEELSIGKKESDFRKGGSPEKAEVSSRLSLGQLRATKGFQGRKGVPGRLWVGRLLLLSSGQRCV